VGAAELVRERRDVSPRYRGLDQLGVGRAVAVALGEVAQLGEAAVARREALDGLARGTGVEARGAGARRLSAGGVGLRQGPGATEAIDRLVDGRARDAHVEGDLLDRHPPLESLDDLGLALGQARSERRLSLWPWLLT